MKNIDGVVFEGDSFDELETFLLKDTWQAEEGIILLSGINPKSRRMRKSFHDVRTGLVSFEAILLLNGERFSTSDNAGKKIISHYKTIFEIWNGCSHPPTGFYPTYTVSYFIEWAKKKNIEIPWLEWAKDNNLPPNNNTPDKPSENKGNNEPSTKARNSYLKTIHALSNALVDGLTGQHNKDAEAILRQLDLKSTEHPITSKTLATYLGDAKKLDDNQ